MSERVVMRYTLDPSARDGNCAITVPVPHDSRLLYAANQGQYAMVLYVELRAKATWDQEFTVYLVKTGESFSSEEDCTPLGVVPLFDGADEWHVFAAPSTPRQGLALMAQRMRTRKENA